ncbi:MAG TPA: VWA domain-containing protein, partial [Pyrinomonadaceae bacterium]|nr:VWA domain-containing protein [Pyrinomonadaceae bacterium]
MPRRLVLAVVALLCVFATSLAQSQSDDVVRITTNLVQVDVIVTKNGKPVRDLKAEDFEVFEDGKRQEIVSFAFVSNVASSATRQTTSNGSAAPTTVSAASSTVSPRMIALVIDDLGLSAQSMADVRRQVRKFIDEKVEPTDLVAIIRTSRKSELPQFTSDKVLMNQAWNDQIVWNNCSRVGVKTLRPDAGAGCGNADASVWASLSSVR